MPLHELMKERFINKARDANANEDACKEDVACLTAT
jgi:hypothetical protein